jgi:tRNA(fMet)-specific endonuclease VapC
MGGFLLIDTSVLVAVERGTLLPEALQRAEPAARMAVSVITASELLHGCHRAHPRARRLSREKFVNSLLAEVEVLPVDLVVAREHARLWADLAERGEIIGPYDLLIAATALAYHLPLATLNDREFAKVKGLDVRALRPYLRP